MKMPAPVPIEIIHDNPSVLGRLALSAGQAQYQRRQHDDAVARDMDFLNREFDRRAQMDQDSMQYELAMNRLAADQDEGERAFALQNALAARRFGSASAPNAPRSTPFSRSVREAVQPKSATGYDTSIPGSDFGVQRGGGYVRSGYGTSRVQGGEHSFEPNVFTSVRQHPDGYREAYETTLSPARRGGSVVPTPTQKVPSEIQTQLDYISRLQGQIPPEQVEALQQIARSGQLTTQQLVNEVQQAAPSLSSRGATRGDIERKINELIGKQAASTRPAVRDRLQTEIDRLDGLLDEKFTNPMGGRSITTNPNPSPAGRSLTPEIMDQFISDATGSDGSVDEYLAEQMARDAGYTF